MKLLSVTIVLLARSSTTIMDVWPFKSLFFWSMYDDMSSCDRPSCGSGSCSCFQSS